MKILAIIYKKKIREMMREIASIDPSKKTDTDKKMLVLLAELYNFINSK